MGFKRGLLAPFRTTYGEAMYRLTCRPSVVLNVEVKDSSVCIQSIIVKTRVISSRVHILKPFEESCCWSSLPYNIVLGFDLFLFIYNLKSYQLYFHDFLFINNLSVDFIIC